MSNSSINNFDPMSAKAWKQKIQFELAGKDYNETLLSKTLEGITIKPFYHIDDFEKLNIPKTTKITKICSQIHINTETEANNEALKTIKKGANSIKFIAKNPFNFELLFNHLLNNNIEFHFHLKFLSKSFVQELALFLKKEIVFFNIDIIGHLALSGNWFTSYTDDFKSIEHLIQKNSAHHMLSVEAGIYQNAGANIVQQVAYALAHTNEYLNAFGSNVAQQIQFNFAIGNHFFFEIAKIRAFRYLLNLVLKEYQTTSEAEIFTEPSLRNKTIYKSKLNALRIVNESMSALLGGANTIANSEKIFFESTDNTLNQVLNLKKHIPYNNVSEIVNDTYYIESLTKQIAEKALQIFKEIEKGGGFLTQLKKGTIQQKITENAQKEQAEFNNGSLILVGSNKYENINEQPTVKRNPLKKRKFLKTQIIPINPRQLAAKLELKRLNNEA